MTLTKASSVPDTEKLTHPLALFIYLTAKTPEWLDYDIDILEEVFQLKPEQTVQAFSMSSIFTTDYFENPRILEGLVWGLNGVDYSWHYISPSTALALTKAYTLSTLLTQYAQGIENELVGDSASYAVTVFYNESIQTLPKNLEYLYPIYRDIYDLDEERIAKVNKQIKAFQKTSIIQDELDDPIALEAYKLVYISSVTRSWLDPDTMIEQLAQTESPTREKALELASESLDIFNRITWP